MPRGGSKPGERRGGRKPGTPNKPKGERAVIALERAESEVRVLVLAREKITSLGKDRLAELDQWAYGMAQKFAPREKESVADRKNSAGCCARAASGHAVAAPPRSVMNSRRLVCRERSIVRGDRC